MATLDWKQPYWTYGNKVLTRMLGRRVCVIIAANAAVAHDLCAHANCWFQFHAYGCIDNAAHFVATARALGLPVRGDGGIDETVDWEVVSEEELLAQIERL